MNTREPQKTSNFISLYKFNTEFNADSVEWCPHEPNKHFFVCGNYQLEEDAKNNKDSNNTANRIGRILLFSINKINGLKLEQSIKTAAVLDQKWCHNQINNLSILGIVNANCSLEIYQLKENKLDFLTKYIFPKTTETNDELLILSLDWSTGLFPSQEPLITCSDSQGNIHVLKLINNKLLNVNSWHAHEYQAWISAFYYFNPNIIFTGGDDAVFLKFNDIRCNTGTFEAKNRLHEAGVTSFHSNKSKEFLVVSGSYDENIRLWDIRNIKKNPLQSIRMPGPIWRLKFDPFNQEFLLAACMLGGVHIIDNINNEKIKIIDSYYEHEKIAYGADWCWLKSEEVAELFNINNNTTNISKKNFLIGSCSFYDSLLCITKVTL